MGDSPRMNANPIQVSAHQRGWPMKALAIWLVDASAIVVLALVMLVVGEFKDPPRRKASK
jgi:hypothetical protein